MKKQVAESQRSFIYMELDELYALSNLPEPHKQQIYQEFRNFLEDVTDTSALADLTDAIYELGAYEGDPFSNLLSLMESYIEKPQLV
ncbi:hypothetical protein [Mesobacillus subterraneus]|uniref:Uncharacterized protein n=1 Tax=Mesobacillus subterraneus TaxID=285983 RepID=A0A427TWK0_9BACI|nr:hypothetical protein [Mesobacillus subterraneus]RSD28696.1 hypothetical protein EJA10_03735 [Mesobacillus subterraneus]